MLFAILKKVIFLVFMYMVQFCNCISVAPCVYYIYIYIIVFLIHFGITLVVEI